MESNSVSKRLASIEKEILDLKGDIKLEHERNNKLLLEFIEELDDIHDVALELLKEKYNAIIPTDENPRLRDLFNESEQLRSIMKQLGKDSLFVERFGFDRTIFEVGNGTNVDQLNEALKYFILDMDSIGIELNESHFNYSVFSSKYMKVFFENLDNEGYQMIMKKCFVNIYWECPQLLIHLEMCVRCLVYENKSIIVKHLNRVINESLRNVGCSKDELIPLYQKTKKKFLELRDIDFYHIYSYFKNKPYKIDLYIDDTHYNNIVSKYVDINTFNSYNDESKKFFMSNIRSLYNDLIEFKMISKFRGIFYYLADLYHNPKEDAKIKYKIARSDANEYEGIKNRLDRKLKFLIKKRDFLSGKSKERLNKINEQIKELSSQVSTEINVIKNETDLIGDLRFVLDFESEISATSTIFEVCYFVSKYYGSLCEISKANNLVDEEHVIEFVDEFRHLQFNPNLTIMNNVSFLEIDNVRELIERNYSMHDIKIDVPLGETELKQVLSDLKYLIRYENIKALDITPEDIKILLNVHALLETLEK